jgi:DNA-directed RNA polymerase sigma subunit (sigma70/sigma32)
VPFLTRSVFLSDCWSHIPRLTHFYFRVSTLQEERITPKDEQQLGRLTQEAIQLQSLYDKLETQLQREPTDDEWCAASGKINMEAIRQAMEEGVEAKNKLVTSNLRLVQGVVNVYIRNGLGGQYNAGDMMQEGILVSYTMLVSLLSRLRETIRLV